MPHTLCLGEDIVGLQSDHWQLSMLPAQSPSPSLATLAVTPTCFLFAVVRRVLARYAQGTTGLSGFRGGRPHWTEIFVGAMPHAVRALMGAGWFKTC